MGDILFYLSCLLIGGSYILYFLFVLLGNKTKISNSNGFDLSKDMISEYNSINIIESTGKFTFYNIKRRVIKLSSKCYYGYDLISISLSLIESGISIIDSKKNKYIDLFRKVFSNLKILYIFPILALLINNVTYMISDVKVSMLFIVIFTVISYVLIDIKSNALDVISLGLEKNKDINKDNVNRIITFINRILWLDKLMFFGELIIILRFVYIML